jgi:hypothetical protein
VVEWLAAGDHEDHNQQLDAPLEHLGARGGVRRYYD